MLTSLRIIYRALYQFGNHNAYQMGAALAYYTLFSIGPSLIIAISIAGMIFGEEAARGNVREELQELIGEDLAGTVEVVLQNVDQLESESWAPQIGGVLLLFVALQAFLHLRHSFCVIWELEPPAGNTWLGILINYGLAVAMVICTGLLLLISLATTTAMGLLERYWHLPLPGGWHYLEIAISFVYLTLVFATMYWVLSGRALHWGYVLYGALICSVLVTFGKTLLGWYIAHSSTTSVYGAAGSLVGFLIWVYYCSLVVFLGAELIQARRTRHDWMK